MKKIKTQSTYKGTNILFGNEKRLLLNKMIELLYKEGYTEINIPIIQHQDTFKNKVGEENNNMMYLLSDKKGRKLCLAPEYTAVIQQLQEGEFKQQKDLKLFYIQECFRGENPQAGRYRQFTQLGVEILNPSKDYTQELISLAKVLLLLYNDDEYTIDEKVTRGLDYYEEGKGFEFRYKDSQILGGGKYKNGIGFAIGIDRLLTIQ